MPETHVVELFLRQNVTEALKSAGKAAASTRLGLAKVGPAVKQSFEMAGSGMTMLNQSLEVGKKAIEVFRQTIGASIETSLKFRKAGDENVEFLKRMRRESDLVKARLGDALIPVIRGFSEAAGAATGSISDWIAENQKLIGSRLVTFLSKTAEILVSGIATAVLLVAKAFYGWQIIIDVVRVAINEMFSGSLNIIKEFLDTTRKVAYRIGAQGLAASIASAQRAIESLGQEFDESSNKAQEGLSKTSEELKAAEQRIKEVGDVVKKVIGEATTAGLKRVDEATVGLKDSTEEYTEALKRQYEIIDAITRRRIAAIESEQQARERAAREADTDMTAEEAGVSVLGTTGGIGSIATAAITSGPVAAAAQAAAVIIESSESLSNIIGLLNEQIGVVVGAMEPLFESLEPLAEIVGDIVGSFMSVLKPLFEALASVVEPIAVVLGPIIQVLQQMNPIMLMFKVGLRAFSAILEALGEVVRKVAGMFLSITRMIAGVWNGVVGAIATVFEKLGGVEIWGKKPLGFIYNWGADLRESATISMTSINEAQRRLDEGYESIADSMEDGAETISDAAEDLADSMSNVPRGIKLAYERFRAALPEEPSTIAAPTPLAPPGFSQGTGSMHLGTPNPFGTTSSAPTFYGDMHFNGVTDLMKLSREVEAASKDRMYYKYGALFGAPAGAY